VLGVCERSGDQIYDSYGRKCNSRFFVNYGFALDENEDNQTVIPLNIPLNDPQYQMKLRFLGGHPSSTRRRFQIPVQYKEKETKGNSRTPHTSSYLTPCSLLVFDCLVVHLLMICVCLVCVGCRVLFVRAFRVRQRQ
jgi:hypothetical protein